MRLSLKYRLIVVLACILSAAFVLISVLNYTATRRAITEEITHASLPLLRENIYSELQRDFLPSVHIASMMATDSFLKNWTLGGEKDPAAVVQYLKEIKDKYAYKSTFFVSGRTGRYYHFEGALKTIDAADSHDRWFYAFRDSGKEYTLDVDTDQAAADRLTIFINYRVDDYAGNFLGVAGVGIVMEDFSAFLIEKEAKYRRRIYLADRGGLIQAHPDAARIQRDTLKDIPGLWEILDGSAKKESQPLDASYEGARGRVLLTVRYVPEIDWFLLVETDERDALRSTRDSLVRTILIGLSASVLIIFLSAMAVNRFHSRLEELASTDSLTGCPNRREFEANVARLLYRRARYGRRASVILIDVDHFKRVNDSLGHQAGDAVLKELAAVVERTKRPDDLFARLGGDEFVVAVESGEEAAMILAERIRSGFASYAASELSGLRNLGLSLGVAEAADGDDGDRLLRKADRALYAAKQAGRNQVAPFSSAGPEAAPPG